ncbi:hypothetical protein FXW78_45025 [Rhodococcus opacus]|nr:hypothetical protein [Rhodococcus opacus]
MGETFLGTYTEGWCIKLVEMRNERTQRSPERGIRGANDHRQREAGRACVVPPGRTSVCGEKSTTVDVGDCEHADSDQRQFMADLVYSGFRHAVDCSRG